MNMLTADFHTMSGDIDQKLSYSKNCIFIFR